MLNPVRKALTVAAAAVALAGLTAGALADETQWQKDHPRRAEVNQRLANQNRRINHEVRDGQISKAQAARMHREDHAIRREERAMASTNGGHITRTEQKALNQQENQVSRQIGR